MEEAAVRKRKQTSDEFPVGIAYVKKAIEQDVRAHFIDGDLSTDIRDELHYYINPDTSERQIQGNIIYPFIGSFDVFNKERSVSPQRVCAYRYAQCNLRVFYKLEQSPDLRCATWNGSTWLVEELLSSTGTATSPIENNNVTNVTGGFGSDGYGPVES
jgi:hypothetical protein